FLDYNILKSFLNENHLGGFAGEAAYGIFMKGEIISMISFKKVNNHIHIYRFCNKLNLIVKGSFKMLIDHLVLNNPQSYITIQADMRYENVDDIIEYGFHEISNKISFSWTNFKETFSRNKFKKDSGYYLGLYKIYDCGQKIF